MARVFLLGVLGLCSSNSTPSSLNGLVVDLQGRQLLNVADMSVVRGSASISTRQLSLFTALLATPDPFRPLLAQFPELVGSDFADLYPMHGVVHHVETSGSPVFAKPRRIDAQKLAVAKTEFLKMEKAGIIRQSTSAWASPLHMVPKPDGSWRPCGDYRCLNTVTTPDPYPVPHIQDFTQRLSGKSVFTKLDLVKGYYQVNMHPADIPKAAIITPFGLWEFVVMPFGLRNAGNRFQRMMDLVGTGLNFTFIYLDDILIASSNMEEHLVHLTKHLDAIKSFPAPADRQQLQRFLGMVNFYR